MVERSFRNAERDTGERDGRQKKAYRVRRLGAGFEMPNGVGRRGVVGSSFRNADPNRARGGGRHKTGLPGKVMERRVFEMPYGIGRSGVIGSSFRSAKPCRARGRSPAQNRHPGKGGGKGFRNAVRGRAEGGCPEQFSKCRAEYGQWRWPAQNRPTR